MPTKKKKKEYRYLAVVYTIDEKIDTVLEGSCSVLRRDGEFVYIQYPKAVYEARIIGSAGKCHLHLFCAPLYGLLQSSPLNLVHLAEIIDLVLRILEFLDYLALLKVQIRSEAEYCCSFLQ
jgi:hypothetical protein